MRYERGRWIAATFSGLGVLVTGLATTLLGVEETTHKYTVATVGAAVIAAAGAVFSIWVNRRIERQRDSRRVFILYARPDIEVAKTLAATLRAAGFNPWLDVEQLSPGAVWATAVLEAIERSVAVVVIVSRNFHARRFPKRELQMALDVLRSHTDTQSPIIPARIDDAPVPASLEKIQWVDLNDAHGLEAVLAGVRSAVEPRTA